MSGHGEIVGLERAIHTGLKRALADADLDTPEDFGRALGVGDITAQAMLNRSTWGLGLSAYVVERLGIEVTVSAAVIGSSGAGA